MTPNNTVPNTAGTRPSAEVKGFDLHRAYRAMIREILRRQLLQSSVSSVKKEEPNG